MSTLSRFAISLSAVSPKFDLLFGTHVCDMLTARSALEQQRLRTSQCKKFNEELLYIFYGKPAYRPNAGTKGKRSIGYFPVCFVVKLNSTITWKRVYPFDSGAYPKRYTAFFQDGMTLDDFLLPADRESARQIVEGFFASNADYYDSKPMLPFRASRMIESMCYYEMIRAFDSGQKLGGDDRLIAVEMQSNGDIILNTTNIHMVLVPDKALEYDDINVALQNCGVPFETYTTGALSVPECHGFINERVRKLNGLTA